MHDVFKVYRQRQSNGPGDASPLLSMFIMELTGVCVTLVNQPARRP